MANPVEVTKAILAEYAHGKLKHPGPREIVPAARLILERADRCKSAARSTATLGHLAVTAKLALQTAALCVRIILDYDLPLPQPKPGAGPAQRE